MARAALALSLLAMLCASVVAQSYVEVFVKWDNNEAETRRAEPVILKELAEQLCKVPQSQVRTVRIENRSSAVNTETWGFYACGVGATPAQLGTIVQNCNDDDNQEEFDDEVQDDTTPDQEMEDITCTLK